MLLIVQFFSELNYCILEDPEPEFMIMIWFCKIHHGKLLLIHPFLLLRLGSQLLGPLGSKITHGA